MWWKAWIWVLLSSIAMSQSPLSLGFLVWKAVLKILISYVAGGFAEILDLWTSHRHCRLSTNIHRRFGACFLRRRKWQPTPVSLLGESHGWRSLVGYSPWGCKESDTTERVQFHFHFHFQTYMSSLWFFFTPNSTPRENHFQIFVTLLVSYLHTFETTLYFCYFLVF